MTTTALKNPNRVPDGVPEGGQFSHKNLSESNIPPLGSFDETLAVAARAELLTGNGYTPPVSLAAVAVPSTTNKVDRWWDRSRLIAEYQAEGRKYEQMPDDYTPAETGGAALSGNRRTHRMNYRGAGMDLRMPSATSIRRFSANHGNRTFDVPVAVAVDGGPAVQRMVRVTKTGPHSWVASALDGKDTENDVKLSEAVTAVLEARRVTMALSAAGDLLARREARRAAEGSELEPVESSFIEEVGYNDREGLMATVIAGKVHTNEVPRQTFELVKTSERPGAAFNKLVKNQGSAGVAARCSKCARFTSPQSQHRCPAIHKHKGGGSPEQKYLDDAKARAADLAANTARTAGRPVPDKMPAAPAPRPAPVVPADYKPRGPVPLVEARSIMSELHKLKPGDPVIMDGKMVQVQEPHFEEFGHPDSKASFRAGYGPGRYNQSVSVSRLAAGYVDLQVPPA